MENNEYKTPYAFIDGSYDVNTKIFGSGCLIKLSDDSSYHIIKEAHKATSNNKWYTWVKMRNVAGEIIAAIRSIEYAINNNAKHITIYYDYFGIRNWVVKKPNNSLEYIWNAELPCTKFYRNYVENARQFIDIDFVYTKAHSGIVMNEFADKLAKESIVEEKNRQDSKILIIEGLSATGKDFITREFVKLGYNHIISYTTRPMRDGETDGVEYNFISKEKFLKLIDARDLIEYKEYDTAVKGIADKWYYGTPQLPGDKKSLYVCIKDISGAVDIINRYPDNTYLLTMTIPDDNLRLERAKSRGSFDETEWNRRTKQDKEKESSVLEANRKLFDRLEEESRWFKYDNSNDNVNMSEVAEYFDKFIR